MDGLIAHTGTQLVGRQELMTFPTPEPTETWKPVPHARVVEVLLAPAATGPEREAFARFLAAVNAAELRLPADPRRRLLRFGLQVN